MKKGIWKSKNSPTRVMPNRNKASASSSQKPTGIEKIQEAIKAQAERSRVNGFIQLGYLPHIFVHEKRYSDALLDRLWKYFECDRVPESRSSKSKYEMWFWMFSRWSGIPDNLWRPCSPISYLPLYDPETRKLKKELYGGRSDTDIVTLEDLKKGIENIAKSLKIDFRLPALLFPEAEEERKELQEQFTHSPDFRSVSKNGKEFTLTPKQAQVVKILFDARKGRTPDLGQSYIIEEVSPDTSTRRVRDLFKGNIDAWKALIEPGSKKGTIRLRE